MTQPNQHGEGSVQCPLPNLTPGAEPRQHVEELASYVGEVVPQLFQSFRQIREARKAARAANGGAA